MNKFKEVLRKNSLLVGIILMLVFSLLVGKFLTKMSYEMAVKNIESPLTNNLGLAFTPSSEVDLQNLDAKLKEKDNLYKGYFSLKSMQDAVATKNNKELPALILNEHYVDPDTFKKEYNGEIGEGLFPIYIAGEYWKSNNLGDIVNFDLIGQNGRKANLNCIIVGSLKYRMVPLFYSGNGYFSALNGTFAIEGLNINEFVDNPYEHIVIDTYMVNELVNYGTNKEVGHVTSRLALETLKIISVIDRTTGYGIYLFISLWIIFLILNFFLGGKYKDYFYLGFSVLVFLSSLIFFKVDIINNELIGNGILLKVALNTYYLNYYISVGAVLFVGISAFLLVLLSNRSKNNKLKTKRG